MTCTSDLETLKRLVNYDVSVFFPLEAVSVNILSSLGAEPLPHENITGGKCYLMYKEEMLTLINILEMMQ